MYQKKIAFNSYVKKLVISAFCVFISVNASCPESARLFQEFPKFLQNNIELKKSNHPQIEEAFVTFATHNYFGILEVLIKSIHAFSTRPVIAYGINDDIPFNTKMYPNLIKRRINIAPEFARPPYIYFFKFAIILDSNIQNGIYVEGDDIVNYKIDDLFALCKNAHQFPLCPVHPDNPDNQQFLMQELGIKNKTNPYVHGHIIFSHECLPFMHECYQTCLTYGSKIQGNWDETVLNVLFWKYKLTNHYLPIYDPTFSAYQSYIKQEPLNMNITIKTPIYYHMFHGAKNPDIGNRILAILKENIGKPVEAIYGVSLDELARQEKSKQAKVKL